MPENTSLERMKSTLAKLIAERDLLAKQIEDLETTLRVAEEYSTDKEAS